MKLKAFTGARRRRADADDVMAAYWAWKRECAAVRAAYTRWAHAATRDACLSFAGYRAALDREEQAADILAQLVSRTQRPPGLHTVRKPTQPSAPFGAS